MLDLREGGVQKVGLWQVVDGKLRRIPERAVDLERQLEEWIEDDPSLLQAGLVIVGRQLPLEGGRLDLLAIDPQGQWVVIEIKRGAIRRETIAQVLDYASCLNDMSPEDLKSLLSDYLSKRRKNLEALLEERDASDAMDPGQRRIGLIVVGVGRSAGLDRMGNYLASKYSVPISIISFDVFADGDKEILAREITEPEAFRPSQTDRLGGTIEQVIMRAEIAGTSRSIRACIDKARDLGLYPHAWKTSIMFAPSTNRTRALFTIWAVPQKEKIKLWVGGEVFTEFYDVTLSETNARLGAEGWRSMTDHEVEAFLAGLEELLNPVIGRTAGT